ncbi:MAG: glycosyltransferase family 39 protein [Selenomonadaceae bacterium]|nr:glycosyltransferase family 39 protein [Selenomonadaceae bacterium]
MGKFSDVKILFVLCLVMFFFGGWLIPITDPTECCYTLTAKEMIEAGDFFSPRIYGDYWYDKPIFFYWELILAYKIFGVNEFASRFFPAVFATLGIFLTYFFGTKLYNKKIGFTAAVILAVSVEYWYIAHAVITDMTLFCAMSVTLMTFYFGYSKKKFSLYYISYAAAGIAVLTKGPIGFLLPGLIILIFLTVKKNLSHLKKMKMPQGLLLMFAIISIWYLPMYIMHGENFFENFIGVHNFLRASTAEHPETNVIYYYAVIFFIGFFPYSFPLFFSQMKKFWNEKNFPVLDMRKKFLLIWAITVFIIFQSFATKYVTYTFPYMMPLAILFALHFADKKILFKRLTAVGVISFLFMFFVAVQLCEENSGRREAEIISPHVDENSCVVSYRKKYSGSLVFYLGEKVYRMENDEGLEKLQPKKMSWTSLNVMPFMNEKDLPQSKKIIAVTDDLREKDLLKIPRNWRLIAELSGSKIYISEQKN